MTKIKNMKTTKQKILLLISSLFLSMVVFASSGETEYIINGTGQHVCTRSLWANNYAPEGMGCFDGMGENNDLVPGAIFTPDATLSSTSLILNGFFVNKAVFDAAKNPGAKEVFCIMNGIGLNMIISILQIISMKGLSLL